MTIVNMVYKDTFLILFAADVNCSTKQFLSMYTFAGSGSCGGASFFECKLPYNVIKGDFDGFAGYKIEDTILLHKGQGIWIYSNF